jgi:hypothetical protein
MTTLATPDLALKYSAWLRERITTILRIYS